MEEKRTKTLTAEKSKENSQAYPPSAADRSLYYSLEDLPEDTLICDRYQLKMRIGNGGFGVVYKAFDMVLKTSVVIKFLDPKITSSKMKFKRAQREINISRKIIHENVVRIFSLEQHEGVFFLVMEYISGQTLKEIISERSAYSWSEFSPIFFKLLSGIRALHDRDIIHRDIKPSNIMITGDGDVKVLDLGLSKELFDTEKTSSIDELVGTPQYMAPEQIRGQDVDKRTDIYQLGLVLYNALTGISPFESGNSTIEMLFSKLYEKSVNLKISSEGIPKYVGFGIEKMVEINKNNRFSSIDRVTEYFSRANYPKFARTFNVIKKRYLFFVLPFLIMLAAGGIFLTCSGYFTQTGAIDYSSDTLRVFSRAGTEIFKKRFENKKIVFAAKNSVPLNGFTSEQPSKEQRICVFLQPESINFKSFHSFKYPWHHDNFRMFVRNRKEFSRISLTNLKRWIQSHMYFDFANDFRFAENRIYKSDLDMDGHEDIFFGQTHSLGMYPSAVYILLKRNIIPMYSPGPFDILDRYTGKKSLHLLLFGYNNLVSHLKFFAVKTLPIPFCKGSSRDFASNTTFIPSLSNESKHNFSGPLFFIPKTSVYISNSWNSENGSIKFRDTKNNNELIEIFNDGRVQKTGSGGKVEFRDSKKSLDMVYDNIDKYYKHKVLSKNWNTALSHIEDSLALNIKNSWVVSALLYFKGDLLIGMGKYKKASAVLSESLEVYPGNVDVFQKQCELEFLRGRPDRALKNLKKTDSDSASFWGLVKAGRDLFECCCRLQSGEFLTVKDIANRIANSNYGARRTVSAHLHSLVNIFSGDYHSAFNHADSLMSLNPSPFTLIENRLLFSRSVILSRLLSREKPDSENRRFAEFFVKDISINSVSYNHLSSISRGYLLALEGKTAEADKLARKSFQEIITLSKGDFFTKFWLFYDAFLYGKTMELTGNNPEAIKGYRLSLQANPHTDLAERSRARIKILKHKI